MLLSADFDGTTINYTSLPRWYVKPDWETERWHYQPREATPDPGIFPVSSTADNWEQTDFCWFPKKWQYFVADLLAMKKYGKTFRELTGTASQDIKTAFNTLTTSDRAFNNAKGTDYYNNYITGEMRGEDPKWESLITCGNYVYETGRKVAVSGPYKGRTFVQLDSFDVNQDPPIVTPATLKDRRVQVAKVVNWKDGIGYLTNFTMLGAGVEVPVPFLTNGKHWYPEWELRKA